MALSIRKCIQSPLNRGTYQVSLHVSDTRVIVYTYCDLLHNHHIIIILLGTSIRRGEIRIKETIV